MKRNGPELCSARHKRYLVRQRPPPDPEDLTRRTFDAIQSGTAHDLSLGLLCMALGYADSVFPLLEGFFYDHVMGLVVCRHKRPLFTLVAGLFAEGNWTNDGQRITRHDMHKLSKVHTQSPRERYIIHGKLKPHQAWQQLEQYLDQIKLRTEAVAHHLNVKHIPELVLAMSDPPPVPSWYEGKGYGMIDWEKVDP